MSHTHFSHRDDYKNPCVGCVSAIHDTLRVCCDNRRLRLAVRALVWYKSSDNLEWFIMRSFVEASDVVLYLVGFWFLNMVSVTVS